MIEENPLVSIIVITYNSAKFVLETLESAKAQTYQYIELIISDDCSTDNTVDICKEWIYKNKDRFVRTELIIVLENKGIPANCNRGVKAAQGEWVKLIAGDDILESNAVSNVILHCTDKPEINIIYSGITQFQNSIENQKKNDNIYDQHLNLGFCKLKTSAEQYQILLRKNIIKAPGVFFKSLVFIRIGYFDEKYPFIEDHPFWLKVTRNGISFSFLNKNTVYYRYHLNSIMGKKSEIKLFSDFYIRERIFRKDYIYPNISFLEKLIFESEYARLKLLDFFGLNRSTEFGKFIFRFTYRINPHFYYYKLYFPYKFKSMTYC